MTIKAYAARDRQGHLSPIQITRRHVRANDVEVDIEYCGVCHSDIHFARGDWGDINWPVVPGHEILGKVSRLGSGVTNLKIGQKVGVGVLVANCGSCESCQDKEENYCPEKTSTYGSKDLVSGGFTDGGYSEAIVVEKDWVFPIAENIYGPGAAPLLCAGITSYAPLVAARVSRGQKVGVVGLGGLGHLGIKFAKALGAHVVMITTSPSKGHDAKQLGADEVLLSTDQSALKQHTRSFNFILNTVPVKHDVDTYLRLLKRGGEMSIVGAIEPLSINAAFLIGNRLKVGGSSIGSIATTHEMLDLCAKYNIVSDVELIGIGQINGANTRVIAGDVKYRFVIDITSLKDKPTLA